jgi:hypothetical protein
VLHSTELASFFNGLGDGERSAKPLCVGSIPTRASKLLNKLTRGSNPLAAVKLPISEKLLIKQPFAQTPQQKIRCSTVGSAIRPPYRRTRREHARRTGEVCRDGSDQAVAALP